MFPSVNSTSIPLPLMAPTTIRQPDNLSSLNAFNLFLNNSIGMRFHSQLVLLMKKELEDRNELLMMRDVELQKDGEGTRSQHEKEEVVTEEMKPSPSGSCIKPFSIENLLELTTSNGLDDKKSSPRDSSSEERELEDVKVYTLESLDVTDGRAKKALKNGKKSTNRCTCEECGKSYATASNLARHKQTHRPLDSPFAKQCPHCPRVYVSMPALSMHVLTHKASHECPECGKVFSRLWLLQGHQRSHSGVRPFGCAHCGKKFADRSNLRAHMLTHSGEKRFSCDRCGRRFTLRSYATRHRETCRASAVASSPTISSSTQQIFALNID